MAAIILLRLISVFPAIAFGHFIRRRFHHESTPAESPKAVFVFGWTGMRGVIVFITYVIFTTLAPQGLTLPTLIRALRLSGGKSVSKEEILDRRRMLRAALRRNQPSELTKYRLLTADLRAVERNTLLKLRDEHKSVRAFCANWSGNWICWKSASRAQTKLNGCAPRRQPVSPYQSA